MKVRRIPVFMWSFGPLRYAVSQGAVLVQGRALEDELRGQAFAHQAKLAQLPFEVHQAAVGLHLWNDKWIHPRPPRTYYSGTGALKKP